MSEDKTTKPSGRLLSKMVKFVTSPTTDWADLERVDSDAPDESSLALKEMIERKRRNDFVRKREFDMLRKLRRRQLAGAAETDSLSSMVSSQATSQDSERERTLEKIDQIEAQMSDDWMGPRSAAPSSAPVPSRAYAPTEPATLGQQLAAGGITSASLESNMAQSGQEIEQKAANEVVMPVLEDVLEPAGLSGFSGLASASMIVEESQAIAELSPEIEEVAIRFANGDVEGAESSLLMQLGDEGGHAQDLEAWLTLFDLYRAAELPDKFDGAAIAFVGRFGRSAPQWELESSPASLLAAIPSVQDEMSGSRSRVHWRAPASIGVQSMATLNASLARQTPPWRLDLSRVREIEPAALSSLVETLERWSNMPVGLRLLGAGHLLDTLVAKTPTDDRGVDPRWWMARLALLRVLDEADEFEVAALNYCVTYEMSPPAWEEPRCEVTGMAETGETLPPPDTDDDGLDASMLPGAGDVPTLMTDVSLVRHALQGEILGDIESLLAPLTLSEQTLVIEFDCRHLQRIDFGAAGAALNWAATQQGAGRQVVFKNVNRLVATFFSIVGVTDVARVQRRVD